VLAFDDSGRVVDAPSRKASALQLDLFAAYVPASQDIKVGVGLVLKRAGNWRVTAQVADGVVGAGVAYRLVPVIDLSVGAGLLYAPASGDVRPSAFVSLYRW
jgi:hypothetical protein